VEPPLSKEWYPFAYGFDSALSERYVTDLNTSGNWNKEVPVKDWHELCSMNIAKFDNLVKSRFRDFDSAGKEIFSDFPQMAAGLMDFL
jgi:hypothetical protein